MKHDWKQTKYELGYKKHTCKRCGATKECYNIYIKYKDKWSPAERNGQRQPFCPKAIVEALKDKTYKGDGSECDWGED